MHPQSYDARRFLDKVIEARTRKAEREIVEYLQRYRRDLPPRLRT